MRWSTYTMISDDLPDVFQTIISESTTESRDNPPLDSYLLLVNDTFQRFDTHEEAKTAASAFARQNPNTIVSILHVVENVGFLPYS